MKKLNIIELFLKIRPRTNLYYHKDTKEFSNNPNSRIQLNYLKEKGPFKFFELYGNNYDNTICLPRYEDLHHNEIMREFVRELVEEKEKRKTLFYILNRRDYIDAFIQALEEFDLYDMFEDVYFEYYEDILKQWLDCHNIKL